MAKKKNSVRTEVSPIEKWTDEYKLLHPTYSQFVTKLHELLAELLRLREIDYHALESRAKDPESFREKTQRPGKSYTDPLSELPDLAALRVIAYYPDDIVRIRELLKEEFGVDPRHSTDKGDELAPDQFGYMSVHEVITLTDSRKLMTEWTRYKDLHAEVQIRTVLQHAWASISHKLQYKHEADVPRPLRRKLVRLSGLLELADEQFSELRRERSEFASQISEKISADNLDLAIDNDSVMTYVKEADVILNIKAEVSRFGFFPVPEGHVSKGLSQLVTVCRELKIETLADLDRALRQVADGLGAFFDAFGKSHGEAHGDTPHWVAVVLVGFDRGERIAPDAVPWSLDYTTDAFKAGNMAFPLRGKRSKA